jgi:hypothetical protein
MKGSTLYKTILFVFLILVFLFEYSKPHEFTWKPTYDKNDKEPFGSFVFDDVLSSSINGYKVTDKTFYQIYRDDSTASSNAFLITEDYLSLTETDIDYLYKLLHNGNKVMLCSDNFPYLLKDTLFFETNNNYYYSYFNQFKRANYVRDSIFMGRDTLNPELIYEVYPEFHNTNIIPGISGTVYVSEEDSVVLTANEYYDNHYEYDTADEEDTGSSIVDSLAVDSILKELENYQENNVSDGLTDNSDKDFEASDSKACSETDDSIIEVETTEEKSKYKSKSIFRPINCDSVNILVWNKDRKPLVIQVFIGKGELYIVSTPFMFTNFSILDGTNASYAFRLLSHMKDKQITRIEAYGAHGDHTTKAATPLRYVLSETPLRWAVYTTLILIILFMIFTAKRRQRIIPVVVAPPNRSLGFMHLISNLYYQRHSNDEIMRMKYLYFRNDVKRMTGIDLTNDSQNDREYGQLSEKTGIETGFIRRSLNRIKRQQTYDSLPDIQLKENIDDLNKIRNALKY